MKKSDMISLLTKGLIVGTFACSSMVFATNTASEKVEHKDAIAHEKCDHHKKNSHKRKRHAEKKAEHKSEHKHHEATEASPEKSMVEPE